MCTWYLVVSVPNIFIKGFQVQNWGLVDFQVFVACFFAFAFAFTLYMFFGSHLILALGNQTTLESFHENSANPYNLGSKMNFRQVFGDSPWLWFIPVPTTPGDGLSFPRRLDGTGSNGDIPSFDGKETSILVASTQPVHRSLKEDDLDSVDLESDDY